jgi:transcriptional regulator with XRE-family HTH domain
MTATSPTMRQRELGKRLRELRVQHELTVEDVGERLLCSATKISRLETGARRPSLRDVRDLCALYNVDESTSAELLGLAKGALESHWAQYEDLKLDPYLELEQDAIIITTFTTYFFPALMQTEEYTRAVIKAITPMMNPDILQQHVEARMRRQQVLERDNRPRYLVLLDEAVLHRRAGESAIMATQIDKILKAQRQGKAAIQIVPFSAGILAAQESNFVLLEFEGSAPMVFLEGLTGNHYLERKADVARYREAIEYMRYSALDLRGSVQILSEMRELYASE